MKCNSYKRKLFLQYMYAIIIIYKIFQLAFKDKQFTSKNTTHTGPIGSVEAKCI